MHALVYVVDQFDLEEAFAPFYDTKLDYFRVGWDNGFMLEREFDQEAYDFENIKVWEDEGNYFTNHAFMRNVNLEYMLMPYAVLTGDGEWIEDEEEINNYLDQLDENSIISMVDIHI